MGAKLVRDRIGDIPWHDEASKAALRPVASVDEHQNLLRMKLLEEVGEFLIAIDRDEQIEEAADILEVLTAMLEISDIAEGDTQRDVTKRAGGYYNEIVSAARHKYTERGGFERGTAWDGTASR